ncbi:MAG: MFS transporter [Treponema sp.]|jgi:DHA1 family multidrug resistance protein-like MFS transporter|nr:MFS transporter [Treponema sp.]
MKLWKSNYSAILIAETMAIAGFAISMPVIPLFLAEDIGIDDPKTLKMWVGAIQSCSALSLAFFAPIWGRLADVYSRRMMLLRAMFGGAVVVSLMVFVRNPLQLLILRTIQGCFTGTIAAATVLTVGIVPASKIALALGLLQTGVAIGNSIGPLMGGLISDFLGHRIAFLSTGLTLGGAGLIVLKWVEDEAPRHHLAKGEHIHFFPDLRPILKSPTLITLMLTTFIIQAANTTAAPMLPLFLREIAGSSRYIGSATGIVLGVGAASTAVASIVAGRYSAYFGYWKTLFFCLAAGAILTVPQAFVTNMVQLTVFRAMSSFCLGGATPVLNAILAVSTDKDHQGSVYGFNSSVSSAGGALGPMIGSAVAMISYRMVFLATAALLGFSAWETRRRESRAREGQRNSGQAK